MKKLFCTLLAATMMVPVTASAMSKNVSSPSVHDGVLTLKNRGSFESDGGRPDLSAWKNKTELEYGINMHFKAAIAADIQKIEGESLDYDATEVKAMYLMTGPESSLQAGVQGGYKIQHGGPDEIEMKLLLAGDAYGLSHKANIGLGHEVGDKSASGVNASAAWGSYYRINENLDVGGEYYADFGNLSDNDGFSEQEHHVGPVVGFSFPLGQRTIDTRLGYLIGLSDSASDHVLKYELHTDF